MLPYSITRFLAQQQNLKHSLFFCFFVFFKQAVFCVVVLNQFNCSFVLIRGSNLFCDTTFLFNYGPQRIEQKEGRSERTDIQSGHKELNEKKAIVAEQIFGKLSELLNLNCTHFALSILSI